MVKAKKKTVKISSPKRRSSQSPGDEIPFVPDFSLLKKTPTDLELSLIGAALFSLTPAPEKTSAWSLASRIEGVSNRL